MPERAGQPLRGFDITTPEKCPDATRHSATPAAYGAWHEWAKEKGKTHRQTRCPTCRFYVIWVKKEATDV